MVSISEFIASSCSIILLKRSSFALIISARVGVFSGAGVSFWVVIGLKVKSSHNGKLVSLVLHFQLVSVSPHPRRV